MAEDMVINPNTVVRAYRELEREGIVVLKHGSGVFVRESVVARAKPMKKAEPIVRDAVSRLEGLRLSEDEIRRLFENELAVRRATKQARQKRA
jgi:GntR family transcriptional regulator